MLAGFELAELIHDNSALEDRIDSVSLEDLAELESELIAKIDDIEAQIESFDVEDFGSDESYLGWRRSAKSALIASRIGQKKVLRQINALQPDSEIKDEKTIALESTIKSRDNRILELSKQINAKNASIKRMRKDLTAYYEEDKYIKENYATTRFTREHVFSVCFKDSARIILKKGHFNAICNAANAARDAKIAAWASDNVLDPEKIEVPECP